MTNGDADCAGFDLEQFRLSRGMTYQKLADFMSIKSKGTLRDYAVGVNWPNAEYLRRFLRRSEGKISLDAMFRRRESYLISIGKLSPTVAERPH